MKSLIHWAIDVSLRPPRATYDLDNTICAIENKYDDLFIRTDVEFDNGDNLKLYGSLWRNYRHPHPTSCIIFLHSLGMNQFECVNIVPFLCTPDLAVFSFDFTGSGKSDGDTIPLIGRGCHDVMTAANFLRTQFQISRIGLWGRSMGAAIGLDTVSISNDFECIVSDSAFASTDQIIYDQAKMNKLPPFFVNLVKPILRKEALKIVGPAFDLNYPLNDVTYASTPLFMGHGKEDSFVPVLQAHELFDKYGCSDKQLFIFDAKHNTPRPPQWYEAAARFIYRKLGIDQKPRMYEVEYKYARLHIGVLNEIISGCM
ncbi:hypothetical protein TRFO_08942 [Tritrichomonas foetus]|uniref:Serine aminopeptidase S33 domain-containing protein n=1 Tax=Tritrichomonas foetus TaxID=1144522 RepID=A0A1J4JI32_9EUKA|nr:hypothetical protein TRFO_08942 [Tritrichomonas foetus]|eukprot:OHS98353.1 hypothetical protein TRFO_08942 [Tritrichomonas foetus]